jgi:PAS domain S-box-containing protein
MRVTSVTHTNTEVDNEQLEETILVIQDYPPGRLEPISTLLSQFGCDVVTAFDGEGGIELAASRPVDLIISDVAMTDMSGLELCRRVRLHSDLKNIPVLLVCGDRMDDELADAAKEAGADDFLELPCDPSHLLAKVIRLTERRRAVELLHQQDLSFKAMIENLPDRITVLSEDGITVYESPAVERQTGYKPEELVGRSNFALIHPDDRQHVMDAGTGALVEYRHRHKDGSWRMLESIGHRMVDESGKSLAIVITRDISERRPSA